MKYKLDQKMDRDFEFVFRVHMTRDMIIAAPKLMGYGHRIWTIHGTGSEVINKMRKR